MRHREPRIESKRTAEGFLRALLAVVCALDELADHPVTATDLRPGGRKSRVELEAAFVHGASLRQPFVGRASSLPRR